MPIYEYKCQSCGHVSEVLVPSFNNTINPDCPDCGSHDLERLFSIPSMVVGKGQNSTNICCGRTERCERPPCSSGGGCARR